MKIALTSDLHGGYSEKTFKIHEEWIEELMGLDYDLLILAGDIGTSKLKDFARVLTHIRSKVTKPIIAVRGNHDLWDKSKYDLKNLLEVQKKVFKDLNIHHCESGPYVVGDVGFYGWDGWYNYQSNYQNDWNFIPEFVGGEDSHKWLSRRTHNEFSRVLEELENSKTRFNVVITHIPCFQFYERKDEIFGGNPMYYRMLVDEARVDYLCYGHTHSYQNEVVDGIRFLNCGSDYDKPKTLIFEVENADPNNN